MRAEHIHRRVDQQRSLSDEISQVYERIISVGENNVSRNRLHIRLQALKETWQSYSANHRAISLAVPMISSSERRQLLRRSYFAENMFQKTSECHLETMEKIQDMLDKCEPQLRSIVPRAPSATSSSSATSTSHPSTPYTQTPSISTWQPLHQIARLPPVDVPKFDGNLSDWLSFKGLYTSLVIDNNALLPAAKLQYLKMSLIGSASHLLKNTAVTAENFAPSWDAVIAYYENNRRLVHTAIQSLFNAKAMSRESAKEMETLYTSFEQTYRTLEALGRPIHQCDDFLVFLISQKLDPDSTKAWELSQGASRQPATWIQMREFLRTRIGSIQAYENAQPSKCLKQWTVRPSHQPVRAHHTSTDGNNQSDSSTDITCPLCTENHFLSYCSRFTGLTAKQRYELVLKKRLCFNCLRSHRLAQCRSTRRCTKCGQRHHTTIHQQTASTQKTVATLSEHEVEDPEVSKHVNHGKIDNKLSVSSIVLLATALVKIIGNQGQVVLVRALLDQGSEISLITERIAQRLCLKRKPSTLSVIGLGTTTSSKTKGQLNIEIQPHFNSEFKCNMNVHILKKLTAFLPSAQTQIIAWPHLSNLQLADPCYIKPGPIDLLIGADLYGQLLEGSIIKGPVNTPVAQQTSLGWIISGPTPQPTHQTVKSYYCSSDHDLHTTLERFWQLEELPDRNSHSLSSEDQKCEEHFMTTHSRDETGRYVVRLPLKNEKAELGDSSSIATRTFHSLQRRFVKHPQLQTAYIAFLKEYEDLGHMKQVPMSDKEPDVTFYLLHHGVIKESSVTTKLRVVFNGSCNVINGKNINDILHTGPKLQIDVLDVFIWVRQFKYIFSCDIEKMYRQISIHQNDWDLQRILWSENPQVPLKYQLTTVTYGLACAPYLALRVIAQLIQDEGRKYPRASEALTKGRYVDDIFGGANTIEEAQQIAQQIQTMCSSGRFPLRKWRSNKPEVLALIPEQHRSPPTAVPIKDDIVQALGLAWNPTLDIVQFSVKHTTTKPTKRGVLSQIAQFFDPLGFISPVIINFKIFMQELWTIKIGWDVVLPTLQLTQWNESLQLLDGLSNLQIPRWLGLEPDAEVQIHGFSDASQLAMAGVVDVRVKTSSTTTTNLICAKTKVAPLKRMTIPRLELSAAVILTKLVEHCREILNLKHVPCYLWTDSSIVYTWLNNHPSRWKDFIHNRVCLIQEILPHGYWRHIPGKSNPADCATRGLSAEELKKHTIWWQGPPWLREEPAQWPQPPPSTISSPKELELRSTRPQVVAHVHKPALWDLIFRYSSLTRLLRITTVCSRMVRLMRKKPSPQLYSEITPTELHEALLYWIQAVQQNSFHSELILLLKGKDLPRTSPILRLLPFVDAQGLLHVGGRLHNSLLPSLTKHPYIIPKESPLSTLIIREAHEKTMHGSTQETLNYIRNRFWILGGRAPVRSFILTCIKCTRYRRNQIKQLIGQLPSTRVTPSPAFSHTGVDYAGPFTLKTWKGRGAKTYKAWISLFVCQSTSAIHLELVTDYTTDAFLAAFRRFVSRRGIPLTMRSDCGTNFKGADQELKKFFTQQSSESKKLTSIIAQDGTTWIFNPPASPHFGGKWEAGVKSMKFHLKRVVGDTLLTFEEMTTVLTQIESILNSRPICPLTDDPDDLNVLTPGHFLIGRSLQTVPEPQLTHLPMNHLSRWQLLTQMVQSFWRKWSKEYLQRHQVVYNTAKATPVNTGTLALIMDERYPPSKWPLGRIIKTHPGKDHIVRVVTLKTGSSTITRPVVKICLLPVLANDIEDSNPGGSKAGGNVKNM